MSLVKYNTALVKPRKSSTGFTFSNTSKMNVSKPVAKITHHRTQLQLDYNSIFIYLSRIWRTLSTESKNAWGSFASAIPQPTKFSNTKYLSGFQCFVRRNYYLILETGSFDNLMLSPDSTVYSNDPATFGISIVNNRLIISAYFERSVADLRCMLFVSAPVTDSISFCGNNYRFITSISSESQDIDITDQYLAAFQKLPDLNDTHKSIFIDYVNCAIGNGQLWFHSTVKKKQPDSFMGLYYRGDIVHYSKTIAADGWRIPSTNDMFYICNTLADFGTCAPYLRELGYTNWSDMGLPANDLFHLNFKGSGIYYPEDDYWAEVKDTCIIQTSTIIDYTKCGYYQFNSEFAPIYFYAYDSLENVPLRVCRTNMGMSDGEFGTYIGNDGKVYKTVCWSNREMITSNLNETKFSDGTDIPIVNSGTAFLESSIPCAVYLNYTPPS